MCILLRCHSREGRLLYTCCIQHIAWKCEEIRECFPTWTFPIHSRYLSRSKIPPGKELKGQEIELEKPVTTKQAVKYTFELVKCDG